MTWLHEQHLKKALLLSRDIGHCLNEFQFLCSLTVLKISQFDLKETFLYLFISIKNSTLCENSLKDNDQLKTSLLVAHGTLPYKLLRWLLSSTAKPQEALYVEELRRTRSLADLKEARCCVEEQILGSPQSWCGIQEIF